jgi:hypothetical protein
MSTRDLTDEQANWLRGLLGTSHLADQGGINQSIVPDAVRGALVEKRFIRERDVSVEVTEEGINAVWQDTSAQKAQHA